MSGSRYAALLNVNDDEEDEGETEQKTVDVTSLYQMSGSSQPLLKEFCETMLPPKSCLNGRERPWKAVSVSLLGPLPGVQVTLGNLDYTVEIAYAGRTNTALSKHFKIHLHFQPTGGNDLSKAGCMKVSQRPNPGNVKLVAHDGQGGHEAFIKSRKCCAAVLRRAFKDRGTHPLPISIPTTYTSKRINKNSFEDGKKLNW